jgi:hypothetical protein
MKDNRIYYFKENGDIEGYRLPEGRITGTKKLAAQRAWIEYKEMCAANGWTILWKGPFDESNKRRRKSLTS